VLELMTRVIDEGRNTVRGLRSSELTNSSLEESFSRMQQEFALSSNTAFRVIVEGTPRTLRPIIRDEIYFIGREGLVNAFRHSGASEIVIEIEYAANHLRILVRDNGRGIDPHVLHTGREGHFGLSGMRERAERIGARLRVLSRAAAGTEIELSVPSRIAFEPQGAMPAKQWLSWLYSRRDNEATAVAETKHHD
jgi:signal transduction histidine kinase